MPDAPRVVLEDSNTLFFYGFLPNEHVRMFAYDKIDAKGYLVGWHEYSVNQDGRLSISFAADTFPCENFAVLGDFSGFVYIDCFSTPGGIVGDITTKSLSTTLSSSVNTSGDTIKISTPTSTATPVPTPCAIAVDANIQSYWREDLGCPIESMHVTWASFTPYERGFVIWRSDDRLIYGFFNGVRWAKDQDRFVEGMPDRPTPNRGEPPPGLLAPRRGTGLVWETNDVFYRNLGWVRIEQKGFCAEVQTFVNGFILQASSVGSCVDSKAGESRSSRANEPDFEFNYVIAYNSGKWLP